MYRGRLNLTKTSLADEKLTEEQLQDKTCMICLDIATFPVSCTVCKSIYCLRCANQWKLQHNSCPKKCQSPWKLDLLKSSEVLLKCPYSKECPRSTPETLIKHLQQCKAAPEDVQQTLFRRKEYLCDKDHKLEFWVSSFSKMSEAKCFQCEDNINSRSICFKCDVKYCVNCRPPPCTKTQCPKGHPYIHHKINSNTTYFCDICGLRIGPIYDTIYDDIKCNFSICSSCMETLPTKTQVKTAINNHQQCRNGHSLGYLKEEEMGLCNHCQNNKRLNRLCKTCEMKYCLDCKPIELRSNNKCHHKHKFQPILCRSCKESPATLRDRQCDIDLCEVCFSELIDVAEGNERLIGQECNGEEKHQLRQNKKKRQCNVCKKQMDCPLFCNDCHTFFCISCRPSKHEKADYRGHLYEYSSTQEPKECLSCCKQTGKVMECDICQICLCLDCYNKL